MVLLGRIDEVVLEVGVCVSCVVVNGDYSKLINKMLMFNCVIRFK